MSSLQGWAVVLAVSWCSVMRSPVDLLPLSSMRSGEGTNSKGSVGLSAWEVVNEEAVAVCVVVADVQNSSANFSATVTKEGIVGTLALGVSAVKSVSNA